MHLHLSQFVKDVRCFNKFRPVELNILARGEMTVTFVVAIGDMSEPVHLRCRQYAIRNGDTYHVGVQLQIQTIHQAKRFEFIFADQSFKPALYLLPKLGTALSDKLLVEFIVLIHVVNPGLLANRW